VNYVIGLLYAKLKTIPSRKKLVFFKLVFRILEHGLNKIVENNDTTLFYTYQFVPNDRKSISSNVINTLYEDTKGRLWIGTGAGLCRYNKKDSAFDIFNQNHGLFEPFINAIIEDNNGNLWVTTRTSLAKFYPERKAFVSYFQSEGINFQYFTPQSCFKDTNGKIYFGGEGGYISFFPDSLISDNHSSHVVFTNFWLNNQKIVPEKALKDGRVLLKSDISVTKSIELKHYDNMLSFEFSTLDFSYPGKIKYAYKLEGFDEKWIYTDANRRHITYTNLEPGNYTLIVKSTNSHGRWNAIPAKLHIIISSPFWQKWWFIILATVLTFLIINILQNMAFFNYQFTNLWILN